MKNLFEVISIDEIKKSLTGYSPEKADDFHVRSAKIANKLFDLQLKKIKGCNKEVILMCGGSASGKTEFIENFLISRNFNGIIFDSTLSNIKGTEIKIRNIKKSGNIPVICFIIPNDFHRCFAVFNKRDRKIPKSRFYETHSGARKVVLWLAKKYPNIKILIYESLYQKSNNKLSFLSTDINKREEIIDFLEKRQYSKEEIKKIIIKKQQLI